jgi:hypothetical protein
MVIWPLKFEYYLNKFFIIPIHKRHNEASNFMEEEVVAKIGIHTKDCSMYN